MATSFDLDYTSTRKNQVIENNFSKYISYLQTQFKNSIELFDIIGDKNEQRNKINEFIVNIIFILNRWCHFSLVSCEKT